jgi:ABC-2 type transport system ATP-binding protein
MTTHLSETVLAVEGLQKVFHDFWRRPRVKAVNGVTFSVHRGEVFGLLGPNGSGKSTTIKMILGLLHPTAGRIAVLGRGPREVAVKARLGYLPEESYLYPFLTAAETLHFHGRLFDLGGGERQRRIDQLLEMVGLAHTGRRRVGEFSKGMMRRVGLASALINDPDLVILDEPTSGLDPLGCRQMKDLIRALARRGKTVLLTSHLLADVEDVCDRIAILYGGRVEALGPIRELLQVRERVNIELPPLDAERLAAVVAAVRAQLGEDPPLTHPALNLESFFMQVVERARSSGGEASGAGAGRAVASYLAAPEAEPAVPDRAAPPDPATPAESLAQAEEKLRRLGGGGGG